MDNATNRVLIQFRDDEGRTEKLWATIVSDGLYQLEHSPSFAYRVSRKDIVRAVADENGELLFERIEEKSGNRTVRILFARYWITSPEAAPILNKIEELGCSYEHLEGRMLNINVPPAVELKKLAEYLIDQGLWWEYADPTRESLFP
jgi:hypothetical protein